MIPFIFAFIYLAALAAADPGTQQWNEFTNNFAIDIAPIITLFDEQVTKQFLSESTSFLDNIIFGVAPLGIITAVVSVIRVYGNASLKSFIGRAQEAHGVAEAELCSSTSEDVCELWSNGGICRVFGRPRILEFFYTPIEDFYPKFSMDTNGDEALQLPSCGIDRPKELFNAKKGHTGHSLAKGSKSSNLWKEVNPRISQDSGHDPERRESDSGHSLYSGNDSEAGISQERFAPFPNLSLNVGMRTVPTWVPGSTAVFGVTLQLSFFVYATWATFYNRALYTDGTSPQLWSFWLAVCGTAFLVIGMILCAKLIERKSCERKFTKTASKDSGTQNTTMFWLQPGGQRVGDQLFNAFAFSQEKEEYVTSWRVDAEPSGNDPDFIRHPLLSLWIAIIFSLSGFVCQFVGLRGLHGSIALYRLASTLCMAIIRSLLRSRRLPWEENGLKDLHRKFEGHELDWQAFRIESSQIGAHGNQEPSWFITGYPSPHKSPDSGTQLFKSDSVEILTSENIIQDQIVGFRPSSKQHGELKLSALETLCANSAVDWIKLRETDGSQPNEAARIMHFRSRLAYITPDPVEPSEQGWNTVVRKMAVQLQEALQDSAEYIFSGNMSLSGDWKDARAIAWSTTCQLSKPARDSPSLPIHFFMHRNSGRWRISKYQLESILGLWCWSLKRLDRTHLFTEKAILVEDRMKAGFTSAIRLWVTQTHAISESIVEMPGSMSTTTALLGTRPPKMDISGIQGESKVLLTIETRSSPSQMIAQDIFTIFISRIADILEPLQDAAFRQNQNAARNILGNSQDQPYMGLMNTHVEFIADKLVDVGIGSRQDVLMSIIPPLLRKSKLPYLDELFEKLLSNSKALRRESKFQVAEDLLKGLLHLGPPQFQERVIKALGELYRAAVASQKQSKRDFGWHGFENMKEMCVMAQLLQEAKDTLAHYESLGKYFKENGVNSQTSRGPRSLNTNIEELLETLESHPAKSRGLTLTQEFDLGKASSDVILEILRWAIKRNSPELVEDLWKVKKTLINETDGNGRTPIFWAIEHCCNADAFQALLEWPSVRLDWHDSVGKTPLLFAAEVGHSKAVELLLEQGAGNMANDSEGRTALSLASEQGYYNIVELLLITKAEVDAKDGRYGSALAAAAYWGETEIAKFLVQKGNADVNMQLQSGIYGSALAAAAYKGQTEVAKFLVQEGKADVNVHFKSGDYGSALAAAAYKGQTEIVKFLVQEGKADVNMQLRSGIYGSALAAAAYGGETEIVKFLV